MHIRTETHTSGCIYIRWGVVGGMHVHNCVDHPLMPEEPLHGLWIGRVPQADGRVPRPRKEQRRLCGIYLYCFVFCWYNKMGMCV